MGVIKGRMKKKSGIDVEEKKIDVEKTWNEIIKLIEQGKKTTAFKINDFVEAALKKRSIIPEKREGKPTKKAITLAMELMRRLEESQRRGPQQLDLW